MVLNILTVMMTLRQFSAEPSTIPSISSWYLADLSKAQVNKKEPLRPKEQYLWFWQDGEFTGDGVNDIHLSINDKQKSRKEKKQT